MAVLCRWKILSLVCPSLHHSQLSARQESKYHLLFDMVNWIFLRGEHNFSFPEIRSKMEEQKLASVHTSQEKWEERHLLIEMRNSPVCPMGNHIQPPGSRGHLQISNVPLLLFLGASAQARLLLVACSYQALSSLLG